MNVPEIRFDGYTDDWEQRKLGELMEVGSVKRVHQSDWRNSGVRFLRARDIVADYKHEEPDNYLYIDEQMYNEYSAQSGKVHMGDLLVTGVGTIGVPMLIDSEKPIYFKDGNIIWFKNKKVIDGDFFYYAFTSKQIQDFIKESAGTGTVGTYTIDSGKKTPIVLPINRAEQERIGVYFHNLGNLIILQQHELDQLKQLKKAMLQKMFPKVGETVPEIRFDEFTDDWEQRKWMDTVDISVNMVDPKSGKYDNLPHIAPGNIESFTGQLYDNIKTVGDEKLISGKFHFYPDDIIYGKINPQLGKYYYSNTEGLTSADAYVLNAKNGLNQKYLFAILQTEEFYKYSVSVSMRSGMPKINRDELNAYSFMAPSYTEQEQIGEFFLNADKAIALRQRKLKKLQDLKSAMLNKMFV